MVPQQEICKVYDRIAPLYDIWGRLAESRARMRAIELAGIANGSTVLEAAVGTGLAFLEIVQRNRDGRNMGIDLSSGMLEQSRQRLRSLPGASYVLAIGTALDLAQGTGTIDILINNYMFDLLADEDLDRALREFKRVLKPGGKLALVNMTKSETLSGGFYELLYRLSPRLMGGCRGVRLTEKLKQQGFSVEVREYHQQMLFPSEVILARA
ncbi:MAG: methyltransferase domain-containing protein [Nitrospirota bacterium]|nr:methyltransferase domain-containing protein [Nitrospirota bacterium]